MYKQPHILDCVFWWLRAWTSPQSHFTVAGDIDGSQFRGAMPDFFAIYDYSPQSNIECGLVANQVYQQLEADTGDGWTKVLSRQTGAKGLVPTSYIEVAKSPPPQSVSVFL
jgi:hypothetical protein